MPAYDYQCESCGKVFEISHGITEPPPETCECGARGTLRRLISGGGGLIFRGSGFYATDYKRNGTGSAKEEKKESDSKKTEGAPTAGPCGSSECAGGCKGE
jgi:putative FmdB family regulatory protein